MQFNLDTVLMINNPVFVSHGQKCRPESRFSRFGDYKVVKRITPDIQRI